LKWLGVQRWKHPVLSGICVFAASATVTFLAAHALPRHAKAIEDVGRMVITGLLGLLILLLIIKAARGWFPKETNTATVAVSVVGLIVYVLGFQTLAATLASSGNLAGILSWLKGGTIGGVGGSMIAVVLNLPLFLILLTLLMFPLELHNILPWDRAKKLTRTLLPAWLAAAAAVFTWIDIVLLHFAGGPLASTSVPVLMVAGFGVATLLLPLYQYMARSCWQYGTAVFDPVRWRAAVVKVRKEIKTARREHFLAGLDQVLYTARYKSNSRADSDS
jgi:hypothetical protein